jgi:hypothetical protein
MTIRSSKPIRCSTTWALSIFALEIGVATNTSKLATQDV